MKVILRSDVDDLGKRGDVVDVAAGYGRNYLVPKGFAIPADPGAVAQAEAMRRARDTRDARARAEAEEVAQALVARVVRVTANAGPGGRLYGSVTSSDVADAVLEQTGFEVDRRQLRMDPLRELGVHTVTAKLHSDVEFPVTVEVVGG